MLLSAKSYDPGSTTISLRKHEKQESSPAFSPSLMAQAISWVMERAIIAYCGRCAPEVRMQIESGALSPADEEYRRRLDLHASA